MGAGERTRQDILRAARKLVRRRGHVGFSLREAARAAGLSAPSVYEYFESREDLLAALGVETRRALREVVVEAASTPGRAGARLVAMGLAYIAFARLHPEDFLLYFVASKDPLTSLDQGLPDDGVLTVAAQVIAAGLEHGELADTQGLGPVDIGYALWSTVHGMAMLRLTYLSSFEHDFDRVDRAALRAVVAGWDPVRARSAKE